MATPVPLDLTLAAATAGLPITAEQFRIDLSQDDLADIAAGLIPVECLRAYAERFSKRPPTPPAGALVRCGDCQHFQRIDHPHTGRCAQGHGRHWLWDTDKRQCEDFEAAGEQPVSHEIENAGKRAANLPLLNIKLEEEPSQRGQENAAVIEGVLEERPEPGVEAERLGEAVKQLAKKFLRDAAMRRQAEANTYPLCVHCVHYAGTGLCSRGRVPALVSQARHCPVREVKP
jgi:hypothetical protein